MWTLFDPFSWPNCELSFQLFTQAVSEKNAGFSLKSHAEFLEPDICYCDEDYDDGELPPGVEDCDADLCSEKLLEDWAKKNSDKICICDKDHSSSSSRSSSSSSSTEGKRFRWANMLIKKKKKHSSKGWNTTEIHNIILLFWMVPR